MTIAYAIASVKHECSRVASFLRTHNSEPLCIVVPAHIFDLLGLDATAMNYAEIGPARYVRLDRRDCPTFHCLIDDLRFKNAFAASLCRLPTRSPHDIPRGGVAVDWTKIEENARVMVVVGGERTLDQRHAAHTSRVMAMTRAKERGAL